VQSTTWLGCQTAIPLPAPPLVAAPPDARQRHRLVGQASPESHWNIGNTGLSHQACQRIPYHSDVVERQQHTADEQSRSGRLFPSCPAVLPRCKSGWASPYFARSFDGGWSSAGVAARLAVCLVSIGKDQYRAAGATSKVQTSLLYRADPSHGTASVGVHVGRSSHGQARDRRRAVRADGCD
jgi:hypothetical protein